MFIPLKFWFLKSLLQVNSNSLGNKQKQKQKNKQNEDWVSKLNCKIEFFVQYNRHQNCLDKYLIYIYNSDLPCKTEQPLQGMELQQEEVEKD